MPKDPIPASKPPIKEPLEPKPTEDEMLASEAEQAQAAAEKPKRTRESADEEFAFADLQRAAYDLFTVPTYVLDGVRVTYDLDPNGTYTKKEMQRMVTEYLAKEAT